MHEILRGVYAEQRTRSFAALRMTGEALRMTGEALRMTGEALRMTGEALRMTKRVGNSSSELYG
jgi:hypothetical protein